MSHDKLKAAVRERMARTGEPYSIARRAVLNERAATSGENAHPVSRWFALRYDANGLNGLTAFLDGVFSLGRPKSGVLIDQDEIRVRSPGFEQRIPRASIRTAHRWNGDLHGTSGVHVTRGSYGIVLLCAAIACYMLQTMLLRAEGETSVLRTAIGSDVKGEMSPLLYCLGIGVSFAEPWLALVVYVGVALIWLVPDRRVERQVSTAVAEPSD